IGARLPELGSQVASDNESLAVLLKLAEGVAREVQEERRVIEDIRRRLLSLSFEKHHSRLEECKTRLSEWSRQRSARVISLFLPDTTTPDQMAEAVSVLEKVFAHLKEAEGL